MNTVRTYGCAYWEFASSCCKTFRTLKLKLLRLRHAWEVLCWSLMKLMKRGGRGHWYRRRFTRSNVYYRTPIAKIFRYLERCTTPEEGYTAVLQDISQPIKQWKIHPPEECLKNRVSGTVLQCLHITDASVYEIYCDQFIAILIY